VLDWSRLETGRIRMDIEDIELKHVIGGAMASIAGLARQRSIQLTSDVPKEIFIRGDEQLILQVFTNLLGNAVKFTPEGGTIRILFQGERDRQWVVTMQDSGIGIPATDLPKLFRIEEKYTRKGLRGEKGTGLGLPVVYEIMQKHNGSIRVESEVGRGTTFILEFPNSRPKDGRSILIIDDDEGVRVLHTRYVRKLLPDATVLQATNGRDGYELARAHGPVAILTDYDMPEMDGFELIKQLRKDQALKSVPVIVITGQDSHSCHEALILSGASDVLPKPMTQERLAEALRPHVEMH
jgi:CheY-like chemotaxis protein